MKDIVQPLFWYVIVARTVNIFFFWLVYVKFIVLKSLMD